MFPGTAGNQGCGPSIMHFTANTTHFYEVLGVDKGASTADIKKAYRKLAVCHHPDKGGDAVKFRELTRAYEVLSDTGKRAKYDELGEDGLNDDLFTVAATAAPAGTEAKAELSERSKGGLAMGTCMLATLVSFLCGASTAAGVVLCAAGRALHGGGGENGRRYVALLMMAIGALLLWPWLEPWFESSQGMSPMLWTATMYAATFAGLVALVLQWDQLPDFLPYLLVAGYLLLYLLVPARASERVLVELPGYVVLTEGKEVESDCALAESAALFTWGMVAIHRIRVRARLQKRNAEDAEYV